MDKTVVPSFCIVVETDNLMAQWARRAMRRLSGGRVAGREDFGQLALTPLRYPDCHMNQESLLCSPT
jgi:hypothetical protein